MIGTLTFHRAHNYGSALQSFALQHWLEKNQMQSEIIDFYPMSSRDLYRVIPQWSGIKQNLKNIFFLSVKNERTKRWQKFHDFQSNDLHLTSKTYDSLASLQAADLPYTSYITGSDQIWNMACYDFDWSYYLEFASKGNFVSYAPSFGPLGDAEQDMSKRDRLANDLNRYAHISVRDDKSADFVESLIHRRPAVTLDPTLLLTKEDWERAVDGKSTVQLPSKYIFFYTLKHNPEDYVIAKRIGEKYRLPVIITNVETKRDLFGFSWRIDAGPWDFLQLIHNAEIVVTSSFHGTVFSILFEKKFVSVNGLTDNRINSLLTALNLTGQSIDMNAEIPDFAHMTIDYRTAKEKLAGLVKDSEDFLLQALEVERHGDL